MPWHNKYPKPEQKRLPDDKVQEIVMWRDRLRAPRGMKWMGDRDFIEWALKIADVLFDEAHFDHVEELVRD